MSDSQMRKIRKKDEEQWGSETRVWADTHIGRVMKRAWQKGHVDVTEALAVMIAVEVTADEVEKDSVLGKTVRTKIGTAGASALRSLTRKRPA